MYSIILNYSSKRIGDKVDGENWRWREGVLPSNDVNAIDSGSVLGGLRYM